MEPYACRQTVSTSTILKDRKDSTAMKKEYKMSQARFEELQKELNYLKTTRSDEVAEPGALAI